VIEAVAAAGRRVLTLIPDGGERTLAGLLARLDPAARRQPDPGCRCVALLAGLRGGRLIPRPSFFQLDNIRKARRRGEPWHLIVRKDLLILRNPPATASTEQHALPQAETRHQPRPLAAWKPAQPEQRAA